MQWRRSRLSLRTRLIALVLGVATMALIAVDVVIPLTTRSALITTKDQTLKSVIANLRFPTTPAVLQSMSENNPLAGEIGWSVVVVKQGTVKVLVHPPGFASATPDIGLKPATSQPATVGDVDSDVTYRTLALGGVRDELGRSFYLVAWIPLADVQQTIDRLVLLEILVSLGLLVLLGGIASVVVRRELRPLVTMARTADEIAAGDLTRRVAPGPVETEVGKLGTAFNGMVDGVSALLAERADSERRMRQFVADASHELRTPVAAIRGYTDLYEAGALNADDAVARAMERMGFESQRMGTLVEDLLTLTQTDVDTAAPDADVDLVPLLVGVVDDAAVIDRSRTWRLAGTSARAVVRGDEMRLHQLFANLLANVRTHTPPGTIATVSVTSTESTVVVAVSDNGPGVDDESLSRIFDRFFRADAGRSRERGGSGLGLSIVASIVRMHRGRVAASAAAGGGLTVTVELPAAAAELG